MNQVSHRFHEAEHLHEGRGCHTRTMQKCQLCRQSFLHNSWLGFSRADWSQLAPPFSNSGGLSKPEAAERLPAITPAASVVTRDCVGHPL